MSAPDVDAVIVGGGHNGLVAAWYLASAGLRVHVFERRAFVGGAAVTQELWPGFHFSPCAHMVHAIHPKIIRDLRLRERGLEVVPRASSIIVNPDGTYYGPADHDSPRNLAFAERLTAEEREGMRRLGRFKRTLNALLSPYRLGPPPTLDGVRARAAGTPAAEVLEQALTLRCSQVRTMFLPTERLRDRYAAEKASVARDPLALSYAYSSIDEPEEETGEKPPHGYVVGGTGAFSRVVAEAVGAAGAQVHVDSEVERFLVEDGRVIGIRLADGTEVRSRVVLSNLDPKRTFLKLFDPEQLDGAFRGRVARLDTEVSCVKLLAAISEAPQWKDWDGEPGRPGQGAVGLHRTRAHVDAMWDDFEAGRPPREMETSFSLPSAVDPSLAPPGQHTASCWIFSAPAKLREGTWDEAREPVAERLIDQITRYAPNFRGSILNYKLRTPLDLERENGLTDGSIWHVQHTGEQLFWNRPLPELARYRAPHAGLYLCGAGQHPGGEVSGLPGHNAAHEVLRDLSNRD
jgi:phytoene dehydrogenase-like protein